MAYLIGSKYIHACEKTLSHAGCQQCGCWSHFSWDSGLPSVPFGATPFACGFRAAPVEITPGYPQSGILLGLAMGEGTTANPFATGRIE